MANNLRKRLVLDVLAVRSPILDKTEKDMVVMLHLADLAMEWDRQPEDRESYDRHMRAEIALAKLP